MLLLSRASNRRASRISMGVVVVTIHLGVRISLVDIRSDRRTWLSIDNDLGSYLRLNYWWKNYDLFLYLKMNVECARERTSAHKRKGGIY